MIIIEARERIMMKVKRMRMKKTLMMIITYL